MGTSHPETKPWIIDRILTSGARYVLDVGAGAGNWADALHAAGYGGQIDALEVWQPYIRDYRLADKYDHVHEGDVRGWPSVAFGTWDVVIFGDVLEHMTEAEAVEVWRRAATAEHSALAIPVIHYHQGPLNGNPYEVHVDPDWTHERVLAAFPGIVDSQVFTVTAAYWR